MTKNYTIRNYQEKDADKMAAFDFMAMLAYRYNKDFKEENIYCAVDVEEKLPEVKLPDNVKIVNWKMETLEEQQKYL